ncbi:MAG TPA: nicotinate (nicotinamide) nucleotide adenylyltransferase [Treponema sp.]|nr:nicotinate (nicotinamide) nucleotide adenylyltransferase [Treponema sp.]
MKIAVLGGSFNPIHIGHLALADEVCSVLHYDKLLFIPTYKPPHKEMADSVSAQQRLEMVNLACMEDGRFEVESCEIDRGGLSYTYDTILHLQEKYSGVLEGKIGLVMGDDLLPGFHLWNHASDIASMCQLILAKRPFKKEKGSHANKDKGDYGKVAYATTDLDGNTLYDVNKDPLFKDALSIQNPELMVSSTEIRRRVAEGKPFKYLVPPSVFRYINERAIYGSNCINK